MVYERDKGLIAAIVRVRALFRVEKLAPILWFAAIPDAKVGYRLLLHLGFQEGSFRGLEVLVLHDRGS